MKALAVDFVDFIELEAGFGFEGGEGADGLSGEGAAVDQEQDAGRDAGFDETVDFVDDGECLAGTGGHGNKHVTLAGGNSGFDRVVGIPLIGAETRASVRRGFQVGDCFFEVASEIFLQGGGGVECSDFARAISFIANIVMPENFAIGGVKKRHTERAGGDGGLGDAL